MRDELIELKKNLEGRRMINAPKKEFNLSDKIINDNDDDSEYGYSYVEDYIQLKDVKEFIKELKEEIRLRHGTDIMDLLPEIDKLAGEELI